MVTTAALNPLLRMGKPGGVATDAPILTASPNSVAALSKDNPRIAKFFGKLQPDAFFDATASKKPMTVYWDTWGHSGVPLETRQRNLILVVAEGGVYGNKDLIIPTNRGPAITKGKIIGVALGAQLPTKPDTNNSGSLDTAAFRVYGSAGESIRLRHMCLDIDENTGMVNIGGWPNDIRGNAGGGYKGRQFGLSFEPGMFASIYSPEDNDADYSTMLRQTGFLR